MQKTVIVFMTPEDVDFHEDKDGNILCFDRLDELYTYLTSNNIPVDLVRLFDVQAEER